MTDLKARYQALLLLKEEYRNWLRMVLGYMTRRKPPNRITLRNGQDLYVSDQPNLHFAVQLARLLAASWKLYDADPCAVILSSPDGVRVRCRKKDGDDLGQVADIFVGGIYGHDFQEMTVVDVGMYIADSSLFFASRGAKKVIGLEPDIDTFVLAQENLRLNGPLSKNITALNLALASEKKKATLHVSNNASQSNTLTPQEGIMRLRDFESAVEVDCTTLEDVMREYSLDEINLLKMNCEGCEYDVMKELSNELMDKIQLMIIGFHNGLRDLIEVLQANNFQISGIRYTHSSRLQGFVYASKGEPVGPSQDSAKR